MDQGTTTNVEHAGHVRSRVPAIVLSSCALAIVALLLLATGAMARQPATAFGLIITCIPLATILAYGHVLGFALTRAASKRGRIERAIEAMMQMLSLAPYTMLVLPPFA